MRSKWYTLIANEVTDVSNKEHLSIVLRYVDKSTLIVREDQVAFIECDEGISGRDLANKITGWHSSCAYPLAPYLHCASHCLNLAVVKSLEVSSVRNMIEVVGRVYRFFLLHILNGKGLLKRQFLNDSQLRTDKN